MLTLNCPSSIAKNVFLLWQNAAANFSVFESHAIFANTHFFWFLFFVRSRARCQEMYQVCRHELSILQLGVSPWLVGLARTTDVLISDLRFWADGGRPSRTHSSVDCWTQFFFAGEPCGCQVWNGEKDPNKKHQIMKAGVWRVRAKNLGGNSQRFRFPGGIHSRGRRDVACWLCFACSGFL